jgi:hypothetical protein
MIQFKSTSVIKHPVGLVYETMRDKLPEIVNFLEDIESVQAKERTELKAGNVRIVNIWQAAPALPSFVAQHIKREMLAWTDRAEWDQKAQECRWEIEPHAFKEWVCCIGKTSFEPAIRGEATKITFSGSLELQKSNGTMKVLSGSTSQLVEVIVQRLIPSNFVKVTKALSHYLDEKK